MQNPATSRRGMFRLLTVGISAGNITAEIAHPQYLVGSEPYVDFQRGETHINMDFALFNELRRNDRARLTAELAELRHFAVYFKRARPTSEAEQWGMLARYVRYLELFCSIMSHPKHCPVPIHLDPGATGVALSKYYLLTGVQSQFAGAYGSWQTADALYKKNPGATVKGYSAVEWPLLESAWHAACERGEHAELHVRGAPTTPATSIPATSTPRSPCKPVTTHQFSGSRASPSVSTSAGVTLPAPRLYIPTRSEVKDNPAPLRTVVIDSRSPSPASSDDIPSPTISTYAVRAGSGGVGLVFEDYSPARIYYHRLRRAGEHPIFAVFKGLTAAVAFIEEEGADFDSAAAPA
ncbi:hypothetical protein B0H11DRAFT_2239169 [Mycena galericulata]|nr:hypothetical protein B0H11DRAFT_2239169 [Mycena galericulata]